MTTSGAQQGIRPGVCLSTTRPASPYIGQIIYMTDVNQSAVWDGTSWVGLDRSRDRNMIINGAMQVAQRATSVAGITSIGMNTADRWVGGPSSAGTWTNAVVADAPSGSGFVNSNRWTCTTAQASLSAGAYAIVYQSLEGQNVQSLAFGSASAKQSTVSFWVKSNVTGTYVTELWASGSKACAASYTINSSGVWERKIVTFVGDTANVIPNTNAFGIGVQFILAAGTSFTSGGSLGTTWNTNQNTRFFGQTNVASAVNNYWQITGVEFEVGPVATPFEFEDYSETLRKCQRYYFRLNSTATETPWVLAYARSTTVLDGVLQFPVPMRVAPTSIEFSSIGALQPTIVLTAISALTYIAPSPYTANLVATTTGLTQYRPYFISNNGLSGFIGFSAEL